MMNMVKLFCCVFFVSFALLAHLSNCDNPSTSLARSSRAGKVVRVGGLNAYVSGSPHSKHAVILATDIFGYEVANLRTIADKVADAGFYAVAPDFFHGDPFDPQNPKRPFEEWIKSHSPVEAVKDAKPVIAALRRRGICSIGFAGFCWGGKLAVELAKTHNIQATVLLHPSLVSVDDIKEVKVPIAIVAAELDEALPSSLLKQFEKILSSKPKVDSQVKIFPGVPHGFTLRYNVSDAKAVKAADEAHQDMIHWLTKHNKLNKRI